MTPSAPVGLDAALEGVRVVELGGTSAAFCGLLLRQLGAEVLRVEPRGGHVSRTEAPTVSTPHGEVGLSYLAHNRGKSILELDLADPTDLAAFEDVLADADVVVRQIEPGSIRLDVEGWRARHPGLVTADISAFGATGPYGSYRGGDLVSAAMSGYVHLTGTPGREPVRMGGEQALKLGGAEAAAGIAVALFHRDSTGEGQHVDLAVRDAVIRANVNAVPKFVYEGDVQERVGDHWGVRDKPLRALWRCQDGWVSFVRRGGAMGSKVNPSSIAWMAEHGHDVAEFDGVDWSEMDMGDPDDRAVIDRLDDKFAVFLAGLSTQYAFEEGLRRGMTLAPVRRVGELLDDAHLTERGFWSPTTLGDAEIRLPGRPVKSGAEQPLDLPWPTWNPEETANV